MPSGDQALSYAMLLHTYPGYTLDRLLRELDENQFNALLDRIPKVLEHTPMGQLAKKF